MNLKGTYTALITPFKEGEIDEEGLRQNVAFQIQEGISGLVPVGTTGESVTLTQEERERVMKIVMSEVKGRVPVFVGTGSNSTASTIEATKRARALGVDGVLVVTPYYNKPTQEGIFRHFEAVAKEGQTPIIVYNNPGRTITNIHSATMQRIAELPFVIGVKDAPESILHTADILHALSSDAFSVVSGEDIVTYPLLALGAQGVISVAANLVPKKMSQMVDAALKGDLTLSRALHYELLPLLKALSLETNPIPIKEAMHLVGMPSGGYRLPLCEMANENRALLQGVLREMGMIG